MLCEKCFLTWTVRRLGTSTESRWGARQTDRPSRVFRVFFGVVFFRRLVAEGSFESLMMLWLRHALICEHDFTWCFASLVRRALWQRQLYGLTTPACMVNGYTRPILRVKKRLQSNEYSKATTIERIGPSSSLPCAPPLSTAGSNGAADAGTPFEGGPRGGPFHGVRHES